MTLSVLVQEPKNGLQSELKSHTTGTPLWLPQPSQHVAKNKPKEKSAAMHRAKSWPSFSKLSNTGEIK